MVETDIPIESEILDFAPLNGEGSSTWLILDTAGVLYRLNADAPSCDVVGRIPDITDIIAPFPFGFIEHQGRTLVIHKSSDSSGLSIWDTTDGARLGTIPGFSATHQHLGARELVEIKGKILRRWKQLFV